MSVLCLDTVILIHGVRGLNHPSSVDRDSHARAFLTEAEKHNDIIMIPTPVLSEYLVGVQDGSIVDVFNEFVHRFQIHPFDSACALLAAQIQRAKNEEVIRDIQRARQQRLTKDEAKSTVKTDIQIISIAKIHGADVLYTFDEGMIRLAKGTIDAKRPPEQTVQGSLLP